MTEHFWYLPRMKYYETTKNIYNFSMFRITDNQRNTNKRQLDCIFYYKISQKSKETHKHTASTTKHHW